MRLKWRTPYAAKVACASAWRGTSERPFSFFSIKKSWWYRSAVKSRTIETDETWLQTFFRENDWNLLKAISHLSNLPYSKKARLGPLVTLQSQTLRSQMLYYNGLPMNAAPWILGHFSKTMISYSHNGIPQTPYYPIIEPRMYCCTILFDLNYVSLMHYFWG